MYGTGINIFALFFEKTYYTSVFAKSNTGINTPILENRQSVHFVYGGLLRAAHVAGRFYFRGSVNLKWSATNIRLTPGGGSKKPKKIGIEMTVLNRLFSRLRFGQLFFYKVLPHA